MIRTADRARASHVQHYYGVDWNDPESYHLVLNTGELSLGGAADLILQAAKHFHDV